MNLNEFNIENFKDVGAAVFMATATATPELFTNLISTFIADSDLGLGAIVGSMMFNILGVAAVSSFVLKEVNNLQLFSNYAHT